MTKIIDTTFFLKLLTLENTVAKGKNDSQSLLNLILHYKSLVEYYDLKKDPIKTYFMEKIQSVIACPKVLCILQSKKIEAESPSFSHQVLKFQRQAIVHSVADMNKDLSTVQTLQEQYEKQRSNIDLIVKSDLQKQEENIKQKLHHRKTSSCMGSPQVKPRKITDLNITPQDSPKEEKDNSPILQLESQILDKTQQETLQ